MADLKAISPLTDATDLMTLRDAARACGTGRTRFAKWLREHRIIFDDQQGGTRVFQNPWVDRGWATDRWEMWENGQGYSWVVYFTAAGIPELRRRWEATNGE